jgi:glycosyltransferase involved in cell wall biosynthesis
MVIVEAYACGTPVVASRIGSVDEVVLEGNTGFKFEVGNAAELASIVNALSTSPERLRQMRPQVRAHFDAHFTAEKNYKSMLDIYTRAIERGARIRHSQ